VPPQEGVDVEVVSAEDLLVVLRHVLNLPTPGHE
jgi:hypothetical protein